MKRIRTAAGPLLALLAAGALLTGSVAAAGGHRQQGYSVTAHGQWTCKSRDSSYPLAHARVELWNSNTDGPSTFFDQPMGIGFTDENGSFTVSGKGSDPALFPWSKPDVYVSVVLNDDAYGAATGKPSGVRLTNELDNSWSTHSPLHDHDNISGDVDIGSWTTGLNADNGVSRCGVWLKGRSVYQEYVDQVGSEPPAGHWDIEYWSAMWAGTPWTNLDTTHWPTGYQRNYTPDWTNEEKEEDETTTLRHEFGHSIRHSFDGDGTHFAGDVGKFRYARTHSVCDETNDGFAFNEGWAEFWAKSYSRCPQPDLGDCPNGSSTECEGNVAADLAELSRCLSLPEASRRASMVAILAQGEEIIHSYGEFDSRFRKTHGFSTNDSRCPRPGLGTHTSALNSGESDPIPWARQVASTRRELLAQARVIAEAKRQLPAATAALSRVRSCRTIPYPQLLGRLRAPAELGAQSQLAALTRARLLEEISPQARTGITKKLATASFYRTLDARKSRLLRDAERVQLAAIDQATNDVTRVLGRSDCRRVLTGELALLHRERAQVAALVRHRAAPPTSLVPTLALPAVVVSSPGRPTPAAPVPSISVGDMSVREGNSGTTAATFTVSLSAPSPKAVSVAYATKDGTASALSDYTGATGLITFPPATTSRQATVNVSGDAAVEPDETFSVQLSNPVNATIAKGTGSVTIVNDDSPATAAPTLSIGDVSLVEGNAGSTDAVFTVSLSGSIAGGVTVGYQTHDGSAQAGSDYAARSGTLTFNAGTTIQQIRVPVTGDTTVEQDERFTVTLTNAANATLNRATGTATIVNDDSVAPPPPPPSSLSDLIVQSIDSLGPDGEVLTVCKVTFTIKNQGSGAAGASTARVYTPTGVSTVAIADVATPALASGQSVQESGVLNTACENIGFLTVIADQAGAVGESDENNNTRQRP